MRMLEPHQERVLAEKQELDERRRALVHFIEHSETFAGLPTGEKLRMIQQRRAMQEYSDALGARIAHFSDTQDA